MKSLAINSRRIALHPQHYYYDEETGEYDVMDDDPRQERDYWL